MRTLHLDTETRSPLPLGDVGVYKYSETPATDSTDGFELLLMSYSTDGGPVEVWSPLESPAPPELKPALQDPNVLKIAHNAGFDRIVCSRLLYGFGVQRLFPPEVFLPPEQWLDTAALAAANGLPRALGRLSARLGIGGKMPEGKDLIQLFNRLPNRLLLEDALRMGRGGIQDEISAITDDTGRAQRGKSQQLKRLQLMLDILAKWGTYKDYNRLDTELLIKVSSTLMPLRNEMEQRIWYLDQRINDRGIQVDTDLARRVSDMARNVKARETLYMQFATGLENPMSRAQFKAWLEGRLGKTLESIDKQHLIELTEEPLPADVQEQIGRRLELNASSIAKYDAMLAWSNYDGRARGCTQYYGAHTGRFSGKGIQLQNLPRIRDDEVPRIARVADGREPLSSMGFGDLKKLIRASLIAPPGGTLTVSDFSSIEARVIAWLAGEDRVLDAARRSDLEGCALRQLEAGGDLTPEQYQALCELAGGGEMDPERMRKRVVDIYKSTWGDMAGVDPREVTSEDRQRGKVTVLALGYAGGVGALMQMGGADLPIPDTFREQAAKEVHQELDLDNQQRYWRQRPLAEWSPQERLYPTFDAYAPSLAEYVDAQVRRAYLDSLKDLYRQTYPNIVRFWRDLEDAFKAAAFDAKETNVGPHIRVTPMPRGRGVNIWLPSGRALRYHQVTWRRPKPTEDDPEPRLKLSFLTGLDTRQFTWRGKLAENVTQAVARDLLCEVMLAADGDGARIVAHVHDEILVEGDFPLEDYMTKPPAWAEGLPIGSSTARSPRYLGH